MAKFNTDTLSLFHTFSKTQVNSDAAKPQFSSLGNTVNKSGHTVQSNEIWTEAIPFFGLGVPADFSSTAQVNDLVKDADGVIWQRNATPYNGSTGTYWTQKTKSITSFTKGTDGKYTFTEVNGALVDGSYLLNAAGVPTVKYHAKKQLTPLVSGNNAFIDSEKDASRLQIDGKWVDQFIGVTDVYVNGSAAVSYAPVLFSNSSSTTPLKAGAGEDYLDYCATGIILWDKNECTGNEVISCFEYVGDKLDTALGNIDGKIQDIVDTTMEGVVSSVGTTEAATNAGISVDSSSKTSPKINISTGTIGGNADAKLVTGSTVKSYVSLLEQKVNDHLVDAAGKLEITVLADKLPKKPFFANDFSYVNSYGFEWEQLSNNIYTNKFEVKVAQSLSGLNEFKARPYDTSVLTPSSLGNGTCKLVIYLIPDGADKTAQVENVATKVAVSQANTFDTSTGIYTFNFDKQISLSAGGRYRIYFQNNDDTNALHCLPVIINSSIENADVTKHETPTRYISGGIVDDYWGCWGPGAGQLNGVEQVTYGPKVSISGLTPTPNEDGNTLSGEKGKIYLIPNVGSENQNVYDEYVWTNNTWEKIGTTKVDLTDYVKSITVNGTTYAANTTNAGALDLGTVVTSTSEDNNPTWDPSEPTHNINLSKEAIYTHIASDGTLTQAITVAGETYYGVSKMFAGNLKPDITNTTEDTAVSVASASKMYDTLASCINNTVTTINGKRSDVELCVHNHPGNDYTAEGNSLSSSSPSVHANLWGMTFIEPSSSNKIILVDDFVGTDNSYLRTANLPSRAERVENNFVYSSGGYLTTTIRPERMVSGFNAASATGLKSFIGDLSNLETSSLDHGTSTFYNMTALTTFIGDLSSLSDGTNMFDRCTSLTTFISDLSSLEMASFGNEGGMFCNTNLTVESVENIADTLPENPVIDTTGFKKGYITISWNQLTSDTEERQELVDALCGVVDKGWRLVTNSELRVMFDTEKYQVVQQTVQPLDLDGEPQEIAYVIKK